MKYEVGEEAMSFCSWRCSRDCLQYACPTAAFSVVFFHQRKATRGENEDNALSSQVEGLLARATSVVLDEWQVLLPSAPARREHGRQVVSTRFAKNLRIVPQKKIQGGDTFVGSVHSRTHMH